MRPCRIGEHHVQYEHKGVIYSDVEGDNIEVGGRAAEPLRSLHLSSLGGPEGPYFHANGNEVSEETFQVLWKMLKDEHIL